MIEQNLLIFEVFQDAWAGLHDMNIAKDSLDGNEPVSLIIMNSRSICK